MGTQCDTNVAPMLRPMLTRPRGPKMASDLRRDGLTSPPPRYTDITVGAGGTAIDDTHVHIITR